ncbi:MAG TPA: hypothetical protein DC057_02370 [Spirochaetia bacterium]|nr:hypothetical protein [Spirochaetia bacterium]
MLINARTARAMVLASREKFCENFETEHSEIAECLNDIISHAAQEGKYTTFSIPLSFFNEIEAIVIYEMQTYLAYKGYASKGIFVGSDAEPISCLLISWDYQDIQ